MVVAIYVTVAMLANLTRDPLSFRTGTKVNASRFRKGRSDDSARVTCGTNINTRCILGGA